MADWIPEIVCISDSVLQRNNKNCDEQMCEWFACHICKRLCVFSDTDVRILLCIYFLAAIPSVLIVLLGSQAH